MSLAVRPGRLRRIVPESWVCRSVDTGVLLTFDDGPDTLQTPAVLERLAAYQVSALFFLVGQRISRVPYLLHRILVEGHELGNHTETHPIFGWSDWSGPHHEIAVCQQRIAAETGVRPEWFRPPLGRLTPGVMSAAAREGLGVMNWSLDSGDWRCRSLEDAQRCTEETLALVRPGDVVLFHDDHRYIGPILDQILPELAHRGWLSRGAIPTRASSGSSSRVWARLVGAAPRA